MNIIKPSLIALVAAAGLMAGAAQARDDVQWSVTIGTPVYTRPAPVYVPAPVYTQPAPVVVYPGYRHYRAPSRWDRDGDGIPNRYDTVYNPRWDRNGNGVPDWREHRRDPRWDGRDDRPGWGR
ncbi:MAG TPA: hypothetical protein VFP68_13120 [Burkholderiaceae bacterium]|nr:hypothetical protein [Burkholderiaceae bacterium]